MPKLVEVYSAKDIPHAHLLKAALAAEGIAAEIGNENLQIVIGEIPAGWPTAPRILVEESQAEQARAFLLELEKKGTGDPDSKPEE